MARIELGEDRFAAEASEREYRGLEAGDILFFPIAPPLISDEDRAFLLTQKQSHVQIHKNVSYRPTQDHLRGIDQSNAAQRERVHKIMRSFSTKAIAFMSTYLKRYASQWKIDFASFRPIEEQGRKVKFHSRNDLLHFDNFPSRPSHGDRLLRLFVNVNPERPRVWVTSDNFASLATQFAGKIGLTRAPGLLDACKRTAVKLGARMGLPVTDRPPYDAFMLRFHHVMKEDSAFQKECRKDHWEFPAGSAWMVFTDTASHACLSGQYMMEQTFIVRRSSLIHPELAPIAILEQIAGYPLARKSA
jgi:hypothetical protein